MSQKLKVLSPIKLKGKIVEPGKFVAIDDDEDAARLIANGTLEDPKAKKEEKSAAK